MPTELVKIPAAVFKDPRLNCYDLVLLVVLFNYSQDNQVAKPRHELIKSAKLSEANFNRALKRLYKLQWLVRLKQDKYNLELELSVPELKILKQEEPGSKIAQNWSKYFGTRLIRFEELEDLKDFVVNYGMEEELVLQIMKYSGERAAGDPFYYTRAILLNLARNGILTLEDYEKEGVYHNGGKVSKTNRKKTTRDMEEFYKKGYQ